MILVFYDLEWFLSILGFFVILRLEALENFRLSLFKSDYLLLALSWLIKKVLRPNFMILIKNDKQYCLLQSMVSMELIDFRLEIRRGISTFQYSCSYGMKLEISSWSWKVAAFKPFQLRSFFSFSFLPTALSNFIYPYLLYRSYSPFHFFEKWCRRIFYLICN